MRETLSNKMLNGGSKQKIVSHDFSYLFLPYKQLFAE